MAPSPAVARSGPRPRTSRWPLSARALRVSVMHTESKCPRRLRPDRLRTKQVLLTSAHEAQGPRVLSVRPEPRRAEQCAPEEVRALPETHGQKDALGRPGRQQCCEGRRHRDLHWQKLCPPESGQLLSQNSAWNPLRVVLYVLDPQAIFLGFETTFSTAASRGAACDSEDIFIMLFAAHSPGRRLCSCKCGESILAQGKLSE
nr:uncharacterized protein LOC129011827 [Pongo pygmaeus]